ncbi:MAG: prolyl aminopeptidase [Halocynthiibacter sp.]
MLKQNPPSLYPQTTPYSHGMLDVGDGHRLYYEEVGNPDGIPVLVLHGGPGGGCSPYMRRFFNPDVYRVILFDQRGCGRSTPHASIAANTTWHLVRDIETLRHHLGVSSWVVFGGSWGSTLALIYAITHPDPVRYLTLRGIFLARPSELSWFYQGGAAQFWPDLWQHFLDPIPVAERGDLIHAYHRRLNGDDKAAKKACAQAWTKWENALATVGSNGHGPSVPSDYALAFARIENHYFKNGAFLKSDNWILENVHRIAHIPGTIVQGRQDVICLPQSAYDLSTHWDGGQLAFIAQSGHAMSEPYITRKLVQVMDFIAG